jgi:hypothetical protein
MAEVSDEEVEKARKAVEDKRAKLAEKQSLRESRERGMTNTLALAQLNAEEAQLDVEIEREHQMSLKGAIKAGSEGVLDDAKAAEKAATETLKAETSATEKEK